MLDKHALLANDLRQLELWQRENLPEFHNAAVQAVINWLVRDGGAAKPLEELYALSGHATGSLRAAVTILSFHGFIEVVRDQTSHIRFVARPSSKLQRRMERYAQRLRQIVKRYGKTYPAIPGRAANDNREPISNAAD